MTEKKKKRLPQSKDWGLVIIGIILVLILCWVVSFISLTALLFLAGSLLSDGEFFAPTSCTEGRDTTRIEELANITFSPSTEKYFVGSSVGGRECSIYISFEIDPTELKSFIDSTTLQVIEPVTSHQFKQFSQFSSDYYSVLEFDGERNRYISKQLYWSFDPEHDYLYGEYFEYPKSQKILIDITNPNRYVVYVVTFLM